MATSFAEVRSPDVRPIGGNYQLDTAVIKGSAPTQQYCHVFEYDKTQIDVAVM